MRLAFTICANNYLAHAAALAESLKRTNPAWQFLIGLVDEPPINLPESIRSQVIPVKQLVISDFEELVYRYNIVELCTAVKPFYFEYILREYSTADQIAYVDPDIYFFGSIDPAITDMGNATIGCTPHALSPIPLDGEEPQDNLFLNHGTFNLGFLLLARSGSTDFLSWWKERTRELCRIDLTQGFFVDQLWFNLAPIYFGSRFAILRDPGLNVAYWNLHERDVSCPGGSYTVGEKHPLVFFHYSQFRPIDPLCIATRGLTRFNLENRPDLLPLFIHYRERLLANGYTRWATDIPVYAEMRKDAQHARQKERERTYSIKRRAFQKVRHVIPEAAKKRLRQFFRE